MSTKFTKPITVNAPGEDVVFDGIDFTGDAVINVLAAKSLTIKNCRFYNIALGNTAELPLIGDSSKQSGSLVDVEVRLIIENNYFGKTDTYNMINFYNKLSDSSRICNNYFTAECCRDDIAAFYSAADDINFDINGNEFEVYGNKGIQFSFYNEPKVTINFNDNIIGPAVADMNATLRGMCRFRPFPSKTTSFAHITMNANNNKLGEGADRIAFCHRKSTRDIKLTEENVPTYYLNGVKTPIEIFDAISKS